MLKCPESAEFRQLKPEPVGAAADAMAGGREAVIPARGRRQTWFSISAHTSHLNDGHGRTAGRIIAPFVPLGKILKEGDWLRGAAVNQPLLWPMTLLLTCLRCYI